jgi:hypothetical protein
VIPTNAIPLLTTIILEASIHAPRIEPFVIAGQIEKESCITLTHKNCFSPRSELKTAREHGIGLGQHTIAYRADGSVRFNAIEEMRTQYKEQLKDWKGERLYDARLQIRATALKDQHEYDMTSGAADHRQRKAFMLASYNSGRGMVQKDRVLCSNTPGCDASRWFDNTEKQGYQSKVKWQGYGKSAFEITRFYVRDVLDVRAPKYEIAMLRLK